MAMILPRNIRNGAGAIAAVAILAAAGAVRPAVANETLRVGIAQVGPIDFTPPQVGMEKGIFQKHGVDLDVVVFAGAAKQQQGLVADAVDFGLGGGPEMSTVAKGTPVIGVAAYAGRPDGLALIAADDGPVKSVADLKGRKASVSSVGSLTEWAVRELSRQQGWGPDGIDIVFLGDIAGQIAALRTHQIDAMSSDVATAARLEEQGVAHTVVRFGQVAPDFIVHVIYATRKITTEHPEQVRAFLAGWFETVAFMKANKDETVKLIAPIMHQSPEIASRAYDVVMPVFSDTGRFEPKALAVLSRSFVEMKLLPSEPDMSKLYTEEFLPGHS
ncbi:MAG TPA: ABC transporter substrate-binding protein [Stellaceae bacterium]|jgi:ABC-type nitrate/sulfonate/bicarbonate transport system substrate-binding protein